jgi:hypothetical protein
VWGIAESEAAANKSQVRTPASKHIFIDVESVLQSQSPQRGCGQLDAVPTAASPHRYSESAARDAYLAAGADSPGRAATAPPALGARTPSPAPQRAALPVPSSTSCGARDDSDSSRPPCRPRQRDAPPLVAPTRPAPAVLLSPAPDTPAPDAPAPGADPDPGPEPEEACPICLDALSRGPAARCSSRRSAAQLVTSLEAADLLRLPGAPAPRAAGAAPPLPPPPDKVATAPCGHVFHAACITVTMAHAFAAHRRPRCPLCRRSLLSRGADSKCVGRAARAHPPAPPPASGPEWPVLVDAARRASRVGRVRLGWAMVRQFLAACCVVGGATCVGLLVRYIK